MGNKKKTTEKIKLTDIVPAEYNPRTITDEELQKLTNSITEFGFVDPIILNLKDNTIIGGHQRYKILLENYEDYKELNLIKLGDIGWAFPSTELNIKDENHEKGLNIALNKISGEWDNKKLEELIEDINPDTFDVGLIGFSDETKEILKFKIEEESATKYSTGSQKVESAENALFRFGKYKIQIPYANYLTWKEKRIKEAEEQNTTVESLLLQYLGLDKVNEMAIEKLEESEEKNKEPEEEAQEE